MTGNTTKTPASRLWLVSISMAVLLHIGLGYLALATHPVEPAGQGAEGVGIELTLSTVGRPVVATTATDTTAMDATADTTTQAAPSQTDTPAAEKPVKPQNQPEPAPEPEKTTPVATAPKVTPQKITPKASTPKPVAAQEQRPKPEPEPQTAQTSEPEVKPEVETASTSHSPDDAESDSEATTTASATPQQPVAPTGTADINATGGNPGIQHEILYLAEVKAWLAQHKTYPRIASMRRQEGIVIMQITIDRGGHILDYQIKEKSGYRLLDKEARKMIERANSVPPIPESIPEDVLELLIPVEFFLV